MVEVRTASSPTSVMTAIRETVRALDPNLPVIDMSTQMEQIETALSYRSECSRTRTFSFGGLALVLAAIGLFGLMSYSVARRTNEIGIRMALGARSQDVLRLIMRESMILVAVGVIIGIAIALGASRLVASLLLRPAADRHRFDDGGDAGDDHRVGVCGLSAGTPRVTRRSDGGAASSE